MKKRSIWIALTSIILIISVIFVFKLVENANEEKNKTLELLYEQTEKATDAYVDCIAIMDDFVAFEREYVENPNWENLINLCVAVDSAQKSLKLIPDEATFLTDTQLEKGRKLGFDFAGLMAFCNIQPFIEDSNALIVSRGASVENFAAESTHEELKNILPLDEKTLDFYRKHLLLGLQILWADFPEYDACKKLYKKHSQFFDTSYKWETDKDILQKQTNENLDEYEEIISSQTRLLGNSEAMLDIEKAQGLTPMIIDGLPTMVPTPLFSADKEDTRYKTNADKEIITSDINDAVKKISKSSIRYTNVSYDEYIEYLSNVDSYGFLRKEEYKGKTDKIKQVIYSINDDIFSVKYENDTVTLDIENIRTMVLLPEWYISNIAPDIFSKHLERRQALKKQTIVVDEYVIPEKDKELIQNKWDKAIGCFKKRINAHEKVLECEKKCLDELTAENLLNLQFYTYIAVKGFCDNPLPDITLNDNIKNKMLCMSAYERAEKNYSNIDENLIITLPKRKFMINEYVWNTAYYNATKHLLQSEYDYMEQSIEIYKDYLTGCVHLVAQNLDKEQRTDFLDYMYNKYPETLNHINLPYTIKSENLKIQSLKNIDFLYDKLLETFTKAETLTGQFSQNIDDYKTAIMNLGVEKDCFNTPMGVTTDRAIPWVFSYDDSICNYVFSKATEEKDYSELVPEDIVSYTITYPNKTYEEALTGIDRLIKKDINVVEEIKEETYKRWRIKKEGKSIIYEWNQNKVTIYFPDKDYILVPYGWYHYFR